MTTSIDLSRIPAPAAIEALSFEQLNTAFLDRFKLAWAAARQTYPDLPQYDVEMLETDPAVFVGEAWSYLRLLDRSRVNDAVRAVLAPLAKGTDLDNIAAGQGIERLVLLPANPQAGTPEVMEKDAELLRRYLLTFSRPAASTRDRYLLEAWSAWPAMLDAKVNGHAVHGRTGWTDLVIIGPGGRLPTSLELSSVRSAVTAPNVQPEGIGVSVKPATRLEYGIALAISVPSGPDPELVRAEAESRVRKAAGERMTIGGQVPAGLLAGAAYGASILAVRDLGGTVVVDGIAQAVSSVIVASDPYTIPILTSLSVEVS